MRISVEEMMIRTGAMVGVCGLVMIFTKDCSSGALGYFSAILFFSGMLMMHLGLRKIEEKK